VRPSRGTHVVLERRFLPGDAAVLLPDVGDGRVAFLVPWRDRVLLGTTDVAMEAPEAEPRASAGEIRELLATAARSLREPPSVEDVRSVFAGVRPLVGAGGRSTASIPRDRLLQVSEGGLVTITAGKWTTYRAMAEEAVDRAAVVAGLPARPCRTATLVLEGAPSPRGVPITEEEVVRAARDEMARTVEDVLARRLGTLLVDARAAVAAAPEAARILARELDRSEEWARAQVADFRELARAYLPDGLADW
jgi:glycerol-3-phosphate dehydrogenase